MESSLIEEIFLADRLRWASLSSQAGSNAGHCSAPRLPLQTQPSRWQLAMDSPQRLPTLASFLNPRFRALPPTPMGALFFSFRPTPRHPLAPTSVVAPFTFSFSELAITLALSLAPCVGRGCNAGRAVLPT